MNEKQIFIKILKNYDLKKILRGFDNEASISSPPSLFDPLPSHLRFSKRYDDIKKWNQFVIIPSTPPL